MDKIVIRTNKDGTKDEFQVLEEGPELVTVAAIISFEDGREELQKISWLKSRPELEIKARHKPIKSSPGTLLNHWLYMEPQGPIAIPRDELREICISVNALQFALLDHQQDLKEIKTNAEAQEQEHEDTITEQHTDICDLKARLGERDLADHSEANSEVNKQGEGLMFNAPSTLRKWIRNKRPLLTQKDKIMLGNVCSYLDHLRDTLAHKEKELKRNTASMLLWRTDLPYCSNTELDVEYFDGPGQNLQPESWSCIKHPVGWLFAVSGNVKSATIHNDYENDRELEILND